MFTVDGKVVSITIAHQISALWLTVSPLITSGAIQYAVPATDDF